MAEALLKGALMSAVNLSEVAAKLVDIGMAETEIRDAIEPLGVEVVTFDREAAVAAGFLRRESRRAGLSLGDRACLALGRERGLPVLTSDTAWASLDFGAGPEIVMLR